MLLREKPPAERQVGAFSLTNQNGETVTQATLEGKVWIACFFFSHCTQTCPQQMTALQELQKRLRPTNVRLIAFTVQPEKDTVAQLQTHAARQGADPERWWFLTGPKAELHRLSVQSFFAAVQENPSAEPGREMSHSPRLYLINRQGKIERSLDRSGNLREGWEVIYSPRLRQLEKDPFAELGGSDLGPFAIDERELRSLTLHAIELDRNDGIPLSQLPLANALLNSTCAVLLLTGWLFIRVRLVRSHAVCMIGAFMVSALFLASYLHYHFYAGDTPFSGQGAIRYFYFALLISHVLLAILALPLVLLTFYRAYRRQWARHARLARWTLPIWMYVSVTGLLVYLFLYKIFAD
jgi:protein SCO1/2/putative membrane protein